ncbi:hypothetical protein RRG08_055590 [Elysia crispata]|uniref:Uncharacterized protein n=1 Tax=Elysia crispata TaxID=231223 RepID=A0AAE1B0L4_9GAST|nr:hypothetical protein RRG08_055590 [Elysia crispata]
MARQSSTPRVESKVDDKLVKQRDHCRPRPRYSTTLTNHVIALPAPPAEPCPDLDLLCHRATRFASGALP